MSGGGGSYLVIEAGTAPVPEVQKEEAHAQPEEADGSSAPQPSAVSVAPAAQKPDPPSVMETAPDRPKPVQVFVAHGRSLKPLDQQADGGTHVASTRQVGRIEVVKIESKGKGFRRLRIRVADA
jgi:misacylated tRNA(Ala) deacylase